jgi:hypothetical protein
MSAITEAPEAAAAPPAPRGEPAASAARVPPYLRAWRYFKGTLVFLIVVFHLAVLAVRNPLDLWYKEMRGWLQTHPEKPARSYWDRHGKSIKLADNFTWKYTNLVGMEQRWCMFSPPLARSAPFLAIRIEFTDGTHEMLLSPNEPESTTSYFRVGGWQTRKLEDYLTWPPGDLLGDPERPLWEAYARHRLAAWRAARPGDPRTVKRIVFVRRRDYFPAPGQKPTEVDAPTEKDLVSFDAEGTLLP